MSTAASFEAYIRRVPVFRELPLPLFEAVAQSFQVRTFNDNDYLFQQGSPTRGMFILLEGEAALMQTGSDGLKRHTGMVRAGQFINMQALFQDGVESASLKAVTPVRALMLARRDMLRLMGAHSELATLMGLKQGQPKLHEARFKMQRDNEHVLLKTHRHPWSFVRWMILPVIVMFVLWGLAGLLQGWMGLGIIFLSLVITGGMMLYLYMEWANDAIIITDQRIIRINYNIPKFSETVNEVLVHSVQEAKADIPGWDPFALLFNYGFIDIKTGGDAGNFRLDFVPNPEAMQKLIMYDHDMRKVAIEAEEREKMQSEIQGWISGNAPAPRAEGQAGVPPTAGGSLLRTRFTTPDGGLVFRKHWMVWLKAVAVPGLILLVDTLLFLLNLFNPTFQSLGVAAWGIWFVVLLTGGLWFIYADWDWRHDYFVLKGSTITIIHQRPLWLQNEKDQVLLRQVDNVVAESTGLLARVFNYGTVRLSLVGADKHKVFDYVPTPLSVQSEITRRQAQLKKQEQEERDRLERERLGEYFSMYHQMLNNPNIPGAQNQPPVPNVPSGYPPNAPIVPAAAPTIRDRNRPPRVPQQRPPQQPGPTMSPGRPYPPQPPVNQYPPAPDAPPDTGRIDTGRPPKFPARRPDE